MHLPRTVLTVALAATTATALPSWRPSTKPKEDLMCETNDCGEAGDIAVPASLPPLNLERTERGGGAVRANPMQDTNGHRYPDHGDDFYLRGDPEKTGSPLVRRFHQMGKIDYENIEPHHGGDINLDYHPQKGHVEPRHLETLPLGGDEFLNRNPINGDYYITKNGLRGRSYVLGDNEFVQGEDRFIRQPLPGQLANGKGLYPRDRYLPDRLLVNIPQDGENYDMIYKDAQEPPKGYKGAAWPLPPIKIAAQEPLKGYKGAELPLQPLRAAEQPIQPRAELPLQPLNNAQEPPKGIYKGVEQPLQPLKRSQETPKGIYKGAEQPLQPLENIEQPLGQPRELINGQYPNIPKEMALGRTVRGQTLMNENAPGFNEHGCFLNGKNGDLNGLHNC